MNESEIEGDTAGLENNTFIYSLLLHTINVAFSSYI